MTDIATRHQITKVRREARRRLLTVAATEQLSPHMLRIRFTSDDFADFDSAAPDDHIKLFLPGGGRDENGKPPMRDYTPRAFDTRAGTLTIDFALHEAGPATAWAMAAKAGDTIQIGGPRGSTVVADDFDWYLLIGDETAIPAIARRIEELRPDAKITALILADGSDDEFALADHPGLTARWAFRRDGGDEAASLVALIDEQPPAGDGYVFIAGEASMARRVRAHIVDALGHPREWVKAAGYWTSGAADTHGRIED